MTIFQRTFGKSGFGYSNCSGFSSRVTMCYFGSHGVKFGIRVHFSKSYSESGMDNVRYSERIL